MVSDLSKVSQSLTTLQFASTHTHTTARTQVVNSYGRDPHGVESVYCLALKNQSYL